MARTFINQSSQIGNSESYVDNLVTGSVLEFTGSDKTIQDDLNALRTMVKSISGEAKWYDGPAVSLFDVNDNLDAEISRAGSVEASLGVVISTETSRATSAESSLASVISAEESRAQSAEGSLASVISTETSRATSAESSLASLVSTEISNEVSRATSAEASLGSVISTETSRATSAESSLASGLSTETSRATSAEASLGSVISVGLSTELSRATSAEASLGSVISTGLSTELSRATSAESSLGSVISSEISRATSAETSLGSRIDNVLSNVDPAALDSLTEIVAAFQSADSNLNGAITSLATALSSSISSEVSRATSVETVLSSSISSEVSRATSVETVLSGAILALQNDRVLRTGDTMTGPLVFSGSGESSTIDPTELSVLNAAAGTNVEAGFISLFVSGTAAVPTAPEHVATKKYVDDQDALKLSLVGGTMSGTLNMGTNYITNVIDPVNAQDAATKYYVDNLVTGLDARSGKTYAVVTDNVSANVAVYGGADPSAKLDTVLPVMTVDFETNFDVYLNGQLMRPGSGNDVVMAQDNAMADRALQFSFPLNVGDVICVVAYT